MQLVATASKEVRTKNFILIALCAIFAVLFVYDGWIGWPEVNNESVKLIHKDHQAKLEEYAKDPNNAKIKEVFAEWPGWSKATDAQKDAAGEFITGKSIPVKYHTRLDILAQKLIAGGLVLATSAAVWWFFRCQRRRVTADENALSPFPGEMVPWDAIRKVDNTLWKKKGKVYISYIDAKGAEKEALLDDYHLEQLRPILQMVAEKAHRAEFIAPETPGQASTTESAKTTDAAAPSEKDSPAS